MLNFALYEKILRLTGKDEKTLNETMTKLAEYVDYAFRHEFLLYVISKSDDKQLEKFTEFVSVAEKFDDETKEKYKAWAQDHGGVDFDEFMENFENKMREMEIEFVKSVRTKLDEKQKKELIDLFYNQAKILDEVENAVSKE